MPHDANVKFCRGKSHPQGEWLSLTKEHWIFNKNGKPYATCRRCRYNFRHVHKPPITPALRVIMAELVARCGSEYAAEVYADIDHRVTQKILSYRPGTIYARTALKIIRALKNRREEDRRNGTINREFRKHVFEVAVQEKHLARMKPLVDLETGERRNGFRPRHSHKARVNQKSAESDN